MSVEKEYICYIIVSHNSNKTYVGITNNFEKRLRQHNGELVGGAKYTHDGRPWRLAAMIKGFQEHKQVLQFEWALKYETKSINKYRYEKTIYGTTKKIISPLYRRGLALMKLIKKDKWTSLSIESSYIPLKICWYNNCIIPNNYNLPYYISEEFNT
jgi:predicted GIY-YIG superfamily endonuclease